MPATPIASTKPYADGADVRTQLTLALDEIERLRSENNGLWTRLRRHRAAFQAIIASVGCAERGYTGEENDEEDEVRG